MGGCLGFKMEGAWGASFFSVLFQKVWRVIFLGGWEESGLGILERGNPDRM